MVATPLDTLRSEVADAMPEALNAPPWITGRWECECGETERFWIAGPADAVQDIEVGEGEDWEYGSVEAEIDASVVHCRSCCRPIWTALPKHDHDGEVNRLPAVTFAGEAWKTFAMTLMQWTNGLVFRLTTRGDAPAECRCAECQACWVTRDIRLLCVEVPQDNEFWHIGLVPFEDCPDEEGPIPKDLKPSEWVDLQDIIEIHLY